MKCNRCGSVEIEIINMYNDETLVYTYRCCLCWAHWEDGVLDNLEDEKEWQEDE